MRYPMRTANFETNSRDLQKLKRASRFVPAAVLLFGIFVGAYFLWQASQEKTPALTVEPQAETVTIPIQGMTCASCVASVKRSLESVDGITEVEVSLTHRHARVLYLPMEVSPERLAAAIDNLGYRAGTPTGERTR